jgi:poly(glycerol-phosphate) alpha-glucosyltransferase
MKIGFLVASVSRKAGGVFEAMRPLACTLASQKNTEVQVFGLQDEFTERDYSKWNPLKPRVFPIMGPPAIGYSPNLSRTLIESDQDLIHAHGVWMYPSVASLAWSKSTNKPHVISPHGMLNAEHLRHSSWKKRIARLLFENKHLSSASCIHALTRLEADAIRKQGFRNPICVIPNGIDIPLKSMRR